MEKRWYGKYVCMKNLKSHCDMLDDFSGFAMMGFIVPDWSEALVSRNLHSHLSSKEQMR